MSFVYDFLEIHIRIKVQASDMAFNIPNVGFWNKSYERLYAMALVVVLSSN